MNKNVNKEDFIKGIELLKKEALKHNVYFKIANCKWVLPFSMYLSEHALCASFWSNVIIQNNVNRVCKCNTMEDICFGVGKCLFVWSDTPQGNTFWSDFLTYKTPTLTNSSVAADLNDVYKRLK